MSLASSKSSAPKLNAASDRPGRALFLVLVATSLFSLAPLAVHFYAKGANPFLFNAVTYSSVAVGMTIYVAMTARLYFEADLRNAGIPSSVSINAQFIMRFLFQLDLTSETSRRTRPSLLYRIFTLSSSAVDDQGAKSTEDSTKGRDIKSKLLNLKRWLWFPLFWLTFARLDYAFFILSAKQVDTAVATTLYEMWPIVMVVILARLGEQDDQNTGRQISSRKRTLMLLAFVGLAIVVLSQNENSWGQMIQTSLVLGVIFGLIAGVLGGMSPASGIRFGDLAFLRYSIELARRCEFTAQLQNDSDDGSTQAYRTPGEPVHDNTAKDMSDAQNVWFAAVAFAIACAIGAPLNLLFALIPGIGGSLQMGNVILWLTAAVTLGFAVIAVASIALRQANLDSRDLGVNSIFFVTPILSILWLGIVGVSLHRADLLWIGAALVFSMNGLIEANPDEEPDYDALNSTPPWGTRLGFTSLILSLWLFGSLVYLRDEVLPAKWLAWSGPDYWALITLSATVFALIFGFRVARLTGRLNDEDRQMLAAFRKVERLVRLNKLPESALEEFRALDTARPANIGDIYDKIRQRLRNGFSSEPEDVAEYFDLQNDLDAVAHSKQQGKDFSELIAIFVFALITIALGLLSRPADISPDSVGWSGFLTEVFVALFISVIVFLAFHLIDMRRDRQIPLIVAHSDAKDEYILFFRYKPDLLMANIVSIVVMVLMICVFVALLYVKWHTT